MLEEVDGLDAVVVPTGGGGLLSGSAIAAHGVRPSIDLYGVEPEAGNDFEQSMEAGTRVSIPVPDTIADGMQTQSPGELTFELACRHNCRIVTVTDDQLKSAMRLAFERLKLVVEPSGAAGLAAALFGKIDRHYKRIGVIISGGNIDIERFAALLSLFSSSLSR
jgi:threonine dehydratase